MVFLKQIIHGDKKEEKNGSRDTEQWQRDLDAAPETILKSFLELSDVAFRIST